jgi:hypothetical protein
MGAREAARQYIRTDVLPQWLHSASMDYCKRFWQWVRILEKG